MRARRPEVHDVTDLDELVLPCWEKDEGFVQKKAEVEKYERELADLTFAQGDAYGQVSSSEALFQDVEALFYANAATEAEVATARQAFEDAVTRQKTMTGRRSVCERNLARCRQELVTAEAEAQQRCARQLQADHLRDMEVYEELLRPFIAIQTRMAQRHAHALKIFPQNIRDASGAVIMRGAGLAFAVDPTYVPWMGSPEVAPWPEGYHGGRVKRHRDLIRDFRKEYGSMSVAVAE